jgi:hypothetical protein
MSCPFKQHRDIFGVPGTGVHKQRFLDVALFDYIGTIILAIIFSKLTKIPLVVSTILMFVLGVVLHMLFGVNTSAVKFLGLTC